MLSEPCMAICKKALNVQPDSPQPYCQEVSTPWATLKKILVNLEKIQPNNLRMNYE